MKKYCKRKGFIRKGRMLSLVLTAALLLTGNGFSGRVTAAYAKETAAVDEASAAESSAAEEENSSDTSQSSSSDESAILSKEKTVTEDSADTASITEESAENAGKSESTEDAEDAATEATGSSTEETAKSAGSSSEVATDLISSGESTDPSEENAAAETASSDEDTKNLEKASEENSEDLSMPAISATLCADNGVTASIDAEEGTFPEGTTVSVRSISREDAISAAQNVVSGDVVDAAAVDITFLDASGNEIEPMDQKKVHVTLATSTEVRGDTHEVVHIGDDGSASKVSDVDDVSGNFAEFDASSFTIYSIVGIDTRKPTVTYRFALQDGTIVSTQRVVNGDTLYEPKVPEKNGKASFDGWYQNGSTERFTGFGEMSGISENADITLTARYIDRVHIYFHDAQGNIAKTLEAEPNSEIAIYPDTPIIKPYSLTTSQDGWSYEPGHNTPDYDVSSEHFKVGDADINLYPIIREGYWVTFNTDGGTEIRSQFIPANAKESEKKAVRPSEDPIKTGYTFVGWYTQPDPGTDAVPYDFDETVTGPLTLYAVYKPAEVSYVVQYWTQYQSDTVNDKWDYRLTAREIRTGLVGEKAEYDDKYIYQSPYDKDSRGYEINADKTGSETIAPDGSTVLNVYYDCRTFHIAFKFNDSEGKPKVVEADLKYTASLKGVYAQIRAYDTDTFTVLSSNMRFVPTDSDTAGYIDTLNDEATMYPYSVTYSLRSRWGWNNYYEIYKEGIGTSVPAGRTAARNMSRRVRDGSADDNRIYYLNSSDSFSAGANSCLPIPMTDFYRGFTFHPELSDGNYLVYTKGKNAGYCYVWFHNHPDWTMVTGNYDNFTAENPMRLYFTRNNYSITYHENGGADVTDVPEVPYEAPLSGYLPSDYVEGKTMSETADHRKVVFAGWYTDNGTFKNKMDFSSTMPSYNLDLYARWKPLTYTVTFDSNGGTAVDPVKNIAYGNTVTKPADPTLEEHVFLGWTTEDGRPYNFADGVTDDITLYANWRSIDAYQVTYDLNGGSGTAPVDNALYYENAGVTVLDGSSVKAPAGKVFLGWRSGADGRFYYPGAVAPMAMHGLTLQAVYGDIAQTASLTYDFNYNRFGIDTTGSTESTVTGLVNHTIMQLADFTSLSALPAGYTFGGWYLTPDCEGDTLTQVEVDLVNEKGNRVYAKWIKNTKKHHHNSSSDDVD